MLHALSSSAPRCVEMLAFFNQATRARACSGSPVGTVAFSLRDPLWGSRPEALVVTTNVTVTGGLTHRPGPRDHGFASWVERLRLGVNGEYERWRGLLAT